MSEEDIKIEENKEPLTKDDEISGQSNSKKKMFLLYGAIAGGILLIAVIILIIVLVVGGSSSDDDADIIAKYSLSQSSTINIISPEYSKYVSSIKIDDKKKSFSGTFQLGEGNHTIEFFLDKSLKLNKAAKMFRECHELVEVNFNEIENKEVENMEEMFYQC